MRVEDPHRHWAASSAERDLTPGVLSQGRPKKRPAQAGRGFPATSQVRPSLVPENWDGKPVPSQFSGTQLGRQWDVVGMVLGRVGMHWRSTVHTHSCASAVGSAHTVHCTNLTLRYASVDGRRVPATHTRTVRPSVRAGLFCDELERTHPTPAAFLTQTSIRAPPPP